MKNIFSQLRSFFSSPSYPRTLALVGMGILVIALPITVAVLQQRTQTQQHAMSTCQRDGTCGPGTTPTTVTCASQGWKDAHGNLINNGIAYSCEPGSKRMQAYQVTTTAGGCQAVPSGPPGASCAPIPSPEINGNIVYHCDPNGPLTPDTTHHIVRGSCINASYHGYSKGDNSYYKVWDHTNLDTTNLAITDCRGDATSGPLECALQIKCDNATPVKSRTYVYQTQNPDGTTLTTTDPKTCDATKTPLCDASVLGPKNDNPCVSYSSKNPYPTGRECASEGGVGICIYSSSNYTTGWTSHYDQSTWPADVTPSPFPNCPDAIPGTQNAQDSVETCYKGSDPTLFLHPYRCCVYTDECLLTDAKGKSTVIVPTTQPPPPAVQQGQIAAGYIINDRCIAKDSNGIQKEGFCVYGKNNNLAGWLGQRALRTQPPPACSDVIPNTEEGSSVSLACSSIPNYYGLNLTTNANSRCCVPNDGNTNICVASSSSQSTSASTGTPSSTSGGPGYCSNASTQFTLNIKLRGIGDGTGENPNPAHPNRNAHIRITDSNGKVLNDWHTEAVSYSNGKFGNSNVHDLGVQDCNSSYFVEVAIPGYLIAKVQIPYGSSSPVEVDPIPGDINGAPDSSGMPGLGDGRITVLDYNLMNWCRNQDPQADTPINSNGNNITIKCGNYINLFDFPDGGTKGDEWSFNYNLWATGLLDYNNISRSQ